MKKNRTLLFFILILVIASCNKKAQLHLHGRVVSGSSSSPIAGMPVELVKEKRVTWPITWIQNSVGIVVTDANGNFDFDVDALENEKDYYQLQKINTSDTNSISWKYPLPEIDIYASEPIPDLTMRVFPREK